MSEDTKKQPPKVPFLKAKEVEKDYETISKLDLAYRALQMGRLLERVLFSLQYGKTDDPKACAAVCFTIVSNNLTRFGRGTPDEAPKLHKQPQASP